LGNDYDSAMTRAGNVLVLSATVLLSLAACSSEDASPASTPVAVTDPTTTAAVTPTSPPTTDSPPTTADPSATLAAEVEADLLEAFRLGREASQDPFNAEKEQAALDRRVGFSRDRLRVSLADYRDRNYAIRPNQTVPASIVVEAPAALIDVGSDVAEVQVCEVNSWILVEVGAGPGGTDAVVNPEVIASRSMIFLRRVDGVWKVEGGDEVGRWEGQAECPSP
jgi:hypothetical protein